MFAVYLKIIDIIPNSRYHNISFFLKPSISFSNDILLRTLTMKARLLFAALNALVAANPLARPSLETIEGVEPAQFAKISIALQPECRGLLEQTLRHLSDPSSRRYGQHLDREEAKALLRPRQASTDAVKGWLSRAGIPAGYILSDGQFIHARAMIEQAQALLGMNHNSTLSSQTIAVSSLPEEIGSHVMTIQYAPVQPPAACPVDKSNTSFAGPNSNRSHLGQAWTEIHTGWEECKSKITPGCLRRLYHVDDYGARHENRNIFGVVGFAGVSGTKNALFIFFW